jgi:hypothetical protein
MGGGGGSLVVPGNVGDLQAKLTNSTLQPVGINQSIAGTQTQQQSYGFTIVESPLSDAFNFVHFNSTCNVPSSGVVQPSATNTICFPIFVGQLWPHNQYSEITLPVGGTNTEFAILVDSNVPRTNAYQLDSGIISLGFGHASTFTVTAIVGGTSHAIDTFTATANVNDKWRFQIDGNVLTTFQNGSLVHTTIDTTFNGQIPGGYPGFGLYNFGNVTLARVSLWAAGGAVQTIQTNAGAVENASPQGNVSLKPSPAGVTGQDGILYVSAVGNDGNDGLSWGTAKKTIYEALLSLPNAVQVPPTAGSGTIYVTGGFTSPFVNGGIWLMGPADPNYANPPAGWLRVTNAGGTSINIVGVPNNQSGPNPHIGTAITTKTNGIGISNGDPFVWLSSTTEPINISNLAGGGGARFALLGECSNGTDRTGTCVVNNDVFNNVHGIANFNSGSGPCVDITGQSYWIWMRDIGCVGNAVLAGPTANNAAAILIDGAANQGNGLISITDANLSTGGIKIVGGSDIIIDNVFMEGDFVHAMPPTVWFTNWTSTSTAILSHIEGGDLGPNTSPCIQVDSLVPAPGAGPVIFSPSCTILGQAIVLNSTQNNILPPAISTANPRRQGQLGFWANEIVGQTDVARRNQALVPARFANLAPSDGTTWGNQDPPNSTITPGQTDPFGGTGAVLAVHNIAGGEGLIIPSPGLSYTGVIGDWIVIGIWELGMGGDNNLITAPTGLTFSSVITDNMLLTNDKWTFRWKAQKVANTASVTLYMAPQYSNSLHPLYYAPVMYIIPNGTISDNEVIEFASSMAATDITCPVGRICNVPGHPLQVSALALGSSNLATGLSGNSGILGQTSGGFTNGNLRKSDANGNAVDSGIAAGAPFVSKPFVPFGVCNNATPGTALSLPTSNAASPACNTGTNIQEGTLNFADGQSAQFTYLIPSDWTGAIDARLVFFDASTSGTVIFQIATSCAATSGSTNDDLVFNTPDAFATITLNATANAQWQTAKTGINTTGCSASNTMQVKIIRTTDTAVSAAQVKGLELTVRRQL